MFPFVQLFCIRLWTSGRKVPLSRSVVNFGAADGVCGIPEDWNFDPANCLAAEGLSLSE